jgi:WD40 repeat protein
MVDDGGNVLPSRSRGAGLLSAFFLSASAVCAQQACPLPPVSPLNPGETSLFTAQQESDLGDVIGQQVAQDDRVIEDEALTSRLALVGERLAAALGPSPVKLRFLLFDLPVANAFSVPGGRIYVSRKIVALLRNDDELAGLLGHEIGHELARHPAFDMSRTFRQGLGVTQLGDRSDVEEKYLTLMDEVRKKQNAFRQSDKLEEAEQRQADAISLYAMAAAGYDPQAMVNFWDRFSDSHGNTGSWLTDLFGATRPESLRLREMLKGQPAVPANCIASRTAEPDSAFREWQAKVINYKGLGHPESVHGLLSRHSLTPPLQGEVHRVRFSPDGKYMLAQDDASIFVVSRETLAPMFRVDARGANPAQFTFDSKSIVFYTRELRVETWDVGSHERTMVREITLPERKDCIQSEISPDGRFLACIDDSLNLLVYDAEKASIVLEKKDFCNPLNFEELLALMAMRIDIDTHYRAAAMHFSPDGKYFVAGSRSGSVEAVELDHFSKVALPGSVKKLLGIDFAFLGPDRLAGVNVEKPDDSAVVRFPGGEHLERLLLGDQAIEAVTQGDYLLLQPVKDHVAGIFDIKINRVFTSSDSTALDIYGDTVATETKSGMIGLYALQGGKLTGSVTLPQGPLGEIRAFGLSKDLNWMALSGAERGAVWDLKKNERVFSVRGFRGAYFSDEGTVYADFDKTETAERSIAKMDIAARQVDVAHTVTGKGTRQRGPYLVSVRPADAGKFTSDNYTIEMHDTRTDSLLWKRDIRGGFPDTWTNVDSGVTVLGWPLAKGAAKNEIKSDPKLAARLGSVKMDDNNYFFEALNAQSGQVEGGFVVDTGKGAFRVEEVDVTGDRAIVVDTNDRILVYSLSTGTLVGRLFGQRPTISPAAALLAVETEPGKLSIYGLEKLQKFDTFSFSERIAVSKLNSAGTQLFVLATDQTAFVLDVSTAARAAAPGASETR